MPNWFPSEWDLSMEFGLERFDIVVVVCVDAVLKGSKSPTWCCWFALTCACTLVWVDDCAVDVDSGRGFGLRAGLFNFFSGLLIALRTLALTLRGLLCSGASFCTGVDLAPAAVTLALTLRGLLCNGGSICTGVDLAAAVLFMVTVIDSVAAVANVTTVNTELRHRNDRFQRLTLLSNIWSYQYLFLPLHLGSWCLKLASCCYDFWSSQEAIRINTSYWVIHIII
jgi:hypothetical protein